MKKLFEFFFAHLLLLNALIGYCQKQNQPNIVWLVAEDQSQYFFPFYGDKSVNLPNISFLLENGIVYDNMNSPYPVCAPARSGIITGMYPSSIGTGNMRAHSDNRIVRGKTEASLEIPYYSSKLAESITPFTQILIEEGYYCTNNSKRDYNFNLRDEAWDDSSNNASWEKREEGQPFFSIFNFNITHESEIWKRDKEKLKVDPNNLTVPPVFPDDSISRHALAVNYSNLVEMDKQMGLIIKNLKDQGLYDNTYIFFYSDHGGPFPRHKRAIYETGSKVPLIVKFPTNIKVKEKRNSDMLSFIDFAPTILSLAGIDIPKIYQGKAFLGNKESKKKRKYLFTASDRFDEHPDRIRAVKSKRFKYIRNYNINKPHALPIGYRNQMPLMKHLNKLNDSNMLSPEQKLWFQVPKNLEEFYDLENDPFELNNLIGDNNYLKELNELRKQLDNWMKEINDLGHISEKELAKLLTEI
jgi:arylsulfatase A-like enzyme|tara:strand:+ start:2402 stop:3808 length:1407 start_codon:yes stop_codon:yes gene_type:complete